MPPVPIEEKQSHGSLKDGLLRRLRQIHGSLQKRAPLEKFEWSSHTPPWPQTKHHQNEDQDRAGGASIGPASRWGECAVILLRQLTDVQEVQVSTVLPSLLHMVRHASCQHAFPQHSIWECEDSTVSLWTTNYVCVLKEH